MKRVLFSFALVAAVIAMTCLSGCATLQASVAKIEGDVIAKVDQAVSFPDLENAKVGAQQLPEPQRTEALQCFNEQEDYLHQVEAALTAAQVDAGATAPTATFNPLQPGFATLAVNAQLAADALSVKVDVKQLLMAKIPPIPRQLIKDCLLVREDSRFAGGKVGLSAAALVASFTAAGKLKAGSAALKSEAAALNRQAAALGAH